MHKLLKSRWMYQGLRIFGFVFLAAYFVGTGDWRFSWVWALGVPAIALATAWMAIASKIFVRFPKLNEYLLYPQREETTPAPSPDEWTLQKANYLESGIRFREIPFTATEDGFICVPVLLIGISPMSALAGGVVFGCLHLARFNYGECLGKAIYYSLAIYFVLPHGLVNVVLGHMLMDALVLVVLRIFKWKRVARGP